VPQGLVATAKKRGAALSWSASTDNVAVSGYAVLRSSTGAAGSYVQTATSRTTAYTDGTLTSGRTYYYEVAAYDVAGNRSAPSKVVTVKAR
jgi:fibronectin type 3 domain-containing protein